MRRYDLALDIPSGWDYSRLTIPLGIRTRRGQAWRPAAEERYRTLVSIGLDDARRGGWELDEPADLVWAIEAGRLTSMPKRGLDSIWSKTVIHESVTLR